MPALSAARLAEFRHRVPSSRGLRAVRVLADAPPAATAVDRRGERLPRRSPRPKPRADQSCRARSRRRRCRPSATTMQRSASSSAAARVERCADRSGLRRLHEQLAREIGDAAAAFSAACSPRRCRSARSTRWRAARSARRCATRRRAHPRARAAIAVRGAERRASAILRRQRRIQRTAVARPDRRASTAISTRRGFAEWSAAVAGVVA